MVNLKKILSFISLRVKPQLPALIKLSVPYNAGTCRWTKWDAFYFENVDDPLDYHYNLMTDSGADPEEVVSNPISCECFFITIM